MAISMMSLVLFLFRAMCESAMAIVQGKSSLVDVVEVKVLYNFDIVQNLDFSHFQKRIESRKVLYVFYQLGVTFCEPRYGFYE